MSLLSRIGLGRTHEPQDGDLLHIYTTDLVQLTKLRERSYMAQTMGKPGAKEEVENYDRMIAVAQRTVLRLTEDKKSPSDKGRAGQ